MFLQIFFLFSNPIQHFPVIREIFGTLIGTRRVAVILWHKGTNERGEFINAALVLDAVIGGYFHYKPRWVEGYLFANLDATHGVKSPDSLLK